MTYDDVCVVVPAYNEGRVIAETLKELLSVFKFVVCVNDGSSDNTAEEAKRTGAHVVNHVFNIGQGGAIQTGIEYGLTLGHIKYFVTFDSDGQHSLNDAKKMISKIKKGHADIVLGSRFLGETKSMSAQKRVVLKLAVYFSNITTGTRLTDTHNGLRVFNRKAASVMNIKLSGMAHASEIIHRIKEFNLRFTEFPVTITYTDYSKAKGQSLMNSINIFFDVLMRKIK